LNIYDTKQIKCYKCGKWIGEAAYDAEIICPKCGDCADPFPKYDDLLPIPVKRSPRENGILHESREAITL